MRGAGTTQSQIGKSCRATFPPAFFADHILQLREHAARARNLNSAFLALTPARRASKGSSFFRDRREISSKIRVGLPESNAISWGAFVPLYSEYDAPPPWLPHIGRGIFSRAGGGECRACRIRNLARNPTRRHGGNRPMPPPRPSRRPMPRFRPAARGQKNSISLRNSGT